MRRALSKYTQELRYLCEYYAGFNRSVDLSKIPEVIANSRSIIFAEDYPIFDINYKPILETKILRHYYLWEIGFETPAMWLLELQTRMNEIMPYYNQLYKSELLEFNPFEDSNYTRHYVRKNDGLEARKKTLTIKRIMLRLAAQRERYQVITLNMRNM